VASDRIESLIAQMTVEEKVGQLGVFADMVRPFAPDVNPEANVRNADQVLQQVREGKVGSLFNGVGAELGRRIQQVATEESRLGIPVILAADVIHGMRTVFPIPLGEAASFEPALAERTARLCAGLEAAAAESGVAVTTTCVGAMFGLFFTSEKVETYAQATACDIPAFNRFFHAMLEQGVFLAPSAYEAGFLSSAHDDTVIEATLAAARVAFRAAKG